MRILLFNLFLVALVFSPAQGFAQQGAYILKGIVLDDGDTIPSMEMRNFYVFEPVTFRTARAQNHYNRLVYNVKKVYPYAKLAGAKMRQYEDTLLTISSEKKQREMMRRAEDEIMDQFGDELKKLTVTQGVILIKLIDRETGQTSFELLREFRGRLSAAFWQTLGRVFGYNLREKYEPAGRDRQIEYIVRQIEAGVI